MKKIIKLFIKSPGNQKTVRPKISDIRRQFENELKDAENKGDKIYKLALQRAYYAYLSKDYS